MSDEVKITVHRGSHQIGGCCTAIEYLSTRILIDMGLPLPGYEQKELEIEGVTTGNVNCDGVLLTHYHGDHIGEVTNVLSSVPIYASVCTKEFIKAYRERMGKKYSCNIDDDRIITISNGKTVTIGDLNVRAIKADHSAAGAFMYLIKAGNKYILHTGDFRLHGKNRNKLISEISSVKKVDLLITEGTTLSRNDSENWDESSVTSRIRKCIEQFKYCFVITSSSNIDRIQSISEAVPIGKYFLMDDFQKRLIDIAVNNEDYVIKKPLTYGPNLYHKMEKSGFVMLIRESNSNMFNEFLSKYPDKTCLIYSMWSGYLEYSGLKKLFDMAGENRRIIHSSGHVVLDDLNEFVNILKPDKIVVIHTDSEEKYGIINSENVVNVEDGVPFYV